MRWTFLLVVLAGAALARAAEGGSEALLEVRRIWQEAPHNAFTDLIRFRDGWICVFREGQGHVSHDGKVRVIASPDGVKWTSAALLTTPWPATPDLRDPTISLMPDGRLMLVAVGANRKVSPSRHQTFAWFSTDGRDWGDPTTIGQENFWLWRVTWHDGKAYGVGYDTAGGRLTRLYRSTTGRTFDVLVERLFDEGSPSEASLAYLPDETCLCLLRRDGRPNSAMLGRARPPYTEWRWSDLGVPVGGPRLIVLADGRLLAAGRLYDGSVRTSLMWLQTDPPALKEWLKLPSGGDTSYPGLVVYDGLLWVSYYSSHEGKTSIYLAKVKLPLAPATTATQGAKP